MIEHPTTGGYGIPLRYTRNAGHLVKQEHCSGEIVVIGTENDPTFDEMPAIFDALLYGQPHRFSDSTALPVPDAARVAYLIGPIPRESSILSPMLHRLESIDGIQPRATVDLPHDGSFRAFCRQRSEREDVLAGFTRLPDGVPFANGVVFAAYRVPGEAGARAPPSTYGPHGGYDNRLRHPRPINSSSTFLTRKDLCAANTTATATLLPIGKIAI
ncbi:MAG: hypothetical protein ACP5GX_05330 [Anaerolineae bacterium]